MMDSGAAYGELSDGRAQSTHRGGSRKARTRTRPCWSSLLPLEAMGRLESRNRLASLYPDEGPLRRALYPKHLTFFAAGRAHQERCMMAANRVGKTFAGGYETALHLTGRYPDWWEGRRFADPIAAWVAGDTAETTRDIVQAALMGPPAELGTGLIPADAIIGEPSRRSGVTGAFDTARIRHASGGVSLLGFKSYDQGRRKFQGTAKHVVWLDEEPPADVYDECMLRLMTTDGLMLCTFTPLEGLTEIVRRFMPQLAREAERQGRVSRFCVQATWDDVPHLTDKQKTALWDAIPEHQRDARTKGIPVLGSGRMFIDAGREDRLRAVRCAAQLRAHHRRRLRHRSSVRGRALRLGSRQRCLVRHRDLSREGRDAADPRGRAAAVGHLGADRLAA